MAVERIQTDAFLTANYDSATMTKQFTNLATSNSTSISSQIVLSATAQPVKLSESGEHSTACHRALAIAEISKAIICSLPAAQVPRCKAVCVAWYTFMHNSRQVHESGLLQPISRTLSNEFHAERVNRLSNIFHIPVYKTSNLRVNPCLEKSGWTLTLPTGTKAFTFHASTDIALADDGLWEEKQDVWFSGGADQDQGEFVTCPACTTMKLVVVKVHGLVVRSGTSGFRVVSVSTGITIMDLVNAAARMVEEKAGVSRLEIDIEAQVALIGED